MNYIFNDKWIARPKIASCATCGSFFSPKSKKNRFCSVKCGRDKNQYIEVNCEICKKPYRRLKRGKYKLGLFCSTECNWKKRNQYWKCHIAGIDADKVFQVYKGFTRIYGPYEVNDREILILRNRKDGKIKSKFISYSEARRLSEARAITTQPS